MADQSSKPLQIFVKLLNGKSITLSFTSPLAYGDQIKQRIFNYTKIPTHLQRLISGGYQISDESSISLPETTVNLVLSLRGGKGGFGSLLRGAATKAGQKKTNNFDACRDMSGRRLRHVNAEKRLEEWKEGEEERKLERVANEFLKKQAMKVKQGVGNGETQKYVEKYREESDKCVEAVELALKESFEKNRKRKGKKMMIVAESGKSKRLKIWKGKGADSDSDDSSEDEEDDDEKSVVLNKDTEESSGSGSGLVMAGSTTHDGESSGKACSGSEEEKEENVVHQSYSDVVANKGEISDVEAVNEVKMDDSSLVVVDAKDHHTEKEENANAGKNPAVKVVVKEQGNDESECKTVEPLSFDDFDSATDMEVLGLERLKSELQSRGLKCGGTLQERAARLFLLKSTPLDKLPKKLLAKK